MMPSESPRNPSLTYFVAASIALHVLMLLFLRRTQLSLGDVDLPPVVVKLLPSASNDKALAPNAVPLAKPPAIQPKDQASHQIVSPSDQENQTPPLGHAYLSDRDNRVEKETIRRGNPDAGAPQPAEAKPADERLAAVAPAAPPAARAPEPAPETRPAPGKQSPPARPLASREPAVKSEPHRKPASGERDASNARGESLRTPSETEPGQTERRRESLPGREQLFAPPAEVLARNDAGAASASRSGGAAAADPHRDLVSAPPPAPGLFGGLRGSADYLPDIAQSNLTLLNTKADRFAPFVRRVGMRVFQNLLIYQRRQLGPQEIIAAHEPVVVRVILGPDGKLKNLTVDDRSGSQAVDQTLLDACREAAFDRNPPAAAANEAGEFTFVFEAQLIARLGDGPHGPALYSVESRLRVGLL
jgi:TonB family protein